MNDANAPGRMGQDLYKVEQTDGGYHLTGPGVRTHARPHEDYRLKLEEMATLLNHCRAVWETERAREYVEPEEVAVKLAGVTQADGSTLPPTTTHLKRSPTEWNSSPAT